MTEIIDLDEDLAFNFTKKIHEKEIEVEELHKKMRLMQFEHEKGLSEAECEIQNQKHRILELEDKLKKNEYHSLLVEVEARLERTENELIKSRENETNLRKELLSVQSKNVNLKVDNDLLNKTRKTRRMSRQPLDQEIIEGGQNMAEIYNELAELRELKNKFEEIQNKIKEGAIETIMEKENELIAIKDTLAEQEIYYKEQIERSIQEIRQLQDQLIRSEHQINLMTEEGGESEIMRMRLQLRDLQDALVQEQKSNKDKLLQMGEVFEQATLEWEEKFSNKENEVNERVRQKLMEQIAISSNVEQNLITELQERDDKIKVLEKNQKDLEKKNIQSQERSEREIRDLNSKISELESKQNIQEEILKVENKFTRKITEIQRDHDNKINEKESYISTIHTIREELMKKALSLEADNKKLVENNNALRKRIQDMDQTKSQSEAKLNEEIASLKETLVEMKQCHEREENRLLGELRRCAAEGRVEEEQETRATMNDGEEEHLLRSENLSLELGGGAAFEYSEKATQRVSIMASPIDLRVSPTKPGANNFSMQLAGAGEAPALNADQTRQIEKLKKEVDSLQRDLEEAEIQVDELEEKNSSLNKEIERLKNEYATELKKVQERENSSIKEQQRSRKTTIMELDRLGGINVDSNLDAISKALDEIERLHSENTKLQSYVSKIKLQFADEKNYLNIELKTAENAAVESKLKYAQVATERDYYQFQYKSMMKDLKSSRPIEGPREARESRLLSIFMCK